MFETDSASVGDTEADWTAQSLGPVPSFLVLEDPKYDRGSECRALSSMPSHERQRSKERAQRSKKRREACKALVVDQVRPRDPLHPNETVRRGVDGRSGDLSCPQGHWG